MSTIGRRDLLVRLGAVASGMALTACAPQTIVRRAIYPESIALDPETVTRMLVAFVSVVVPETAAAAAIVRRFADPALKFTDYQAPLTADLMRRARECAGTDRFDRLPAEVRLRIVAEGVGGGAVSSRLYTGAVLLTRVVYFCGLWNEKGACDFIGYEGAFTGASALSWPEPERFLPVPTSPDGNPA